MARRRKQQDEPAELSPDEKIIREAKERFKRAWAWESEFRTRYVDDVKFACGDSDNLWQWPEAVQKQRNVAGQQRPMLTINKVRRLCDKITNDARQNKPSINIKPTNNLSSYKSSQVYEGVVRNIEYVSNAQSLYDTATDSQVEGGIGYWRVNTRYLSDEVFDQELILEGFADQLGVLLDCDIKTKDGADALWGFVFESVAEEEFKRQYPDVEMDASTGIDDGDDWWIKDGDVRVAEYYRIVQTKDTLIYVKDEEDNEATFFKSEIPKQWRDKVKEEKDSESYKSRPVWKKKLEWKKIAANQVIDHRDLPGTYIPIVRVVGFERRIDGKLERKGYVRGLKDAQRMYNYNSSGQVEYGALQTKTPWVGAADCFMGNETAWNSANTTNAAYLTFKHVDSEGNALPPQALPQRPDPPGASPAFVTGMQIADNELSMVSGQENPSLGKEGQEKSGKAIGMRQRQGDLATYHFIDNLAVAIRHTGKIIIQWFPKVYDTERVIQILGRDGSQTHVHVKPGAEEALNEEKDPNSDVMNVLFNPAVGQYEVEADIGPAYATQRQEAWNAFVQIVTGAPDLINEIGDLMFQSADFPLANQIAERLKRKIRKAAPWLLDDDAPGPEQQQMAQQINDMSNQIAELLQKVAEQNLIIRGKDQKRDVDAFKAETDRIRHLANTIPELIRTGQADEAGKVIDQTLKEMLESADITSSVNEDQDDEHGRDHIPPGAEQAPDGHHYIKQGDQHFRVMKPGEFENAGA